MENGLVLLDLLRDLEPEVPRTWPSAPRFMESGTAHPQKPENRLDSPELAP